MKLIIDIPEEEYERIKDIPNDYKLLIHKAVANGTPFDSCEDCISRAEAIKIIREIGDVKGAYFSIQNAIENELPSVQPISVIEDIKAEINNIETDAYIQQEIDRVISIIDKHISGKGRADV